MEILIDLALILLLSRSLLVVYNFMEFGIFLTLKHYYAWLLSIVILLALFWIVSHCFELNVSVPFFANLYLIYKRIPPKNKLLSHAEIDKLCFEMYGVKNGRVKHRASFFLLTIVSLVSAILLYGEVRRV